MKDWALFLLCCLFSAGAWFMYNMSREYSGMVYVPVLAVSELEGRAPESSSESVLAARVKASGFRLAKLSRPGRRGVRVAFAPEDMERMEDDVFRVNSSCFTKYVQPLFGDGVSLESFASDGLTFRFQERAYRKVPVLPVASLSYRPQYTSARGLDMVPDSLAIYGDPAVLDGIRHVLTKPISIRDMDRTVHGSVQLDIPKGVSCMNESVSYTIEVQRYVEVSKTLKIRVRNVPSGVHFSVLPPTAEAVFRCNFPISGNGVDNASLYVDYNEFVTSMSGHCLIHVEGLGQDVLHCSVTPEICDCFEER